MLDGLRKIGRTWFGKILGALLIIGLAGFGFSNFILDSGTNTVARVGNEDVTVRDFSRAYDNEIRAFSNNFGMNLTAEQALNMGIPSLVLNRLAADRALDQLGKDLGVGVSEDKLSKMLRADPRFAGTLGQFDRTSFLAVVQRLGMTEAEFLDSQTEIARREQLFQGLVGASPMPSAAEELLNRHSGDTRVLDYFVLSGDVLPPVAEPTEEELAAYLTEHQTEFRTEEKRTVDILVLSPETIAASKTITDDAIAAEYERTKASRTKVEKRTIQQVALTAEQKAAFEAGKAAGKTFDQLLTENGLTATQVGSYGKDGITDPALADAAFGLAAAGDFVVIPGIGGERAISVSAIEAGGEVPLDQVRDEIRQGLALAEARAEYLQILDQVEELRAALKPLSDVSTTLKLPVQTVTLTRSGSDLIGTPGMTPQSITQVATAIFAADPAQKATPTVQINSNNNVWFDLKSVEAARDQTMDEVRDDVVNKWTAEKTEDAVVVEVEKAVQQLAAGQSLVDVAVGMGQVPTQSAPLSRAGDGTPVLDSAVATAAFGGGLNHYGSAVNGQRNHVVFQVTDIIPATEPSEQVARQTELRSRFALYGDFVNGLVEHVGGLRLNRQTFEALVNPNAGVAQ